MKAYLPPSERWYDFFTGARVTVPDDGVVSLEAPLDTMPLHIRGRYC